MRRLAILLLITMFLYGCTESKGQLGSDAPLDSVPDLVGTYVLNGTDHLGNDYGGHLTILSGDNPGEYKMQWIIIESIQEGIGILEGNQLEAHWNSIDNQQEFYEGTVKYTVTVNGELHGIRTVEGKSGEGFESAFPNQ